MRKLNKLKELWNDLQEMRHKIKGFLTDETGSDSEVSFNLLEGIKGVSIVKHSVMIDIEGLNEPGLSDSISIVNTITSVLIGLNVDHPNVLHLNYGDEREIQKQKTVKLTESDQAAIDAINCMFEILLGTSYKLTYSKTKDGFCVRYRSNNINNPVKGTE